MFVSTVSAVSQTVLLPLFVLICLQFKAVNNVACV